MELLPRCLPAFLPVCATTNAKLNWTTGADTDLPMVAFAGLLPAARIVVRAPFKVRRRFGTAPVAAVVAAGFWSISAGSGVASVPQGTGRSLSGSRRCRGSGFPGAMSAAG